ncbi:MSHA biogenesis protein MshI [Thalassotalea piscium]|uniref:MSHA biogenesis protein MshI n=1 Tax=Thalassotalea piscium TaxID=1230533 RepID=A0A7X0TUY6_9GAMM|nr:MSHA biogenesis protein MshI [Thalassotalea piscium]MBB6544619.1 MSHA biogenesis protein MshI [Thalassotalea piscium]
MRIRSLFSKPGRQSQVGLCFRQESIAFCSVDPQGSVDLKEFEVVDKNYLASLKSMAKELPHNGLCHLVLSPQQSQIVQIDKPNIPNNELKEALKWQIKDLVSIDPNDMVLDYFDAPITSGGIEKLHVVCAAKSELSPFVEQLMDSGVTVQTITIEEFAFTSLVPESDDACLLVCQQPNEEIILLIVKQGKLYFYRRLRGMAGIATKSEDELSMSVIDALSLEIQRSTDYYERQLKQAPIRSIEVLVPIENEAFLARKLAENTHVPVNIFTLPEAIANSRSASTCFGACALTNMEEV